MALDANLTLLWVVGTVSKDLITRHKRLAFGSEDYDLLVKVLSAAHCVVSTPNSLTEVSNIADFGVPQSDRRKIAAKFKDFIASSTEQYIPSAVAIEQKEFSWLGISDCAWLCALDNETHLLTVDHMLYQAALKRGMNATNFNHLREGYGTV